MTAHPAGDQWADRVCVLPRDTDPAGAGGDPMSRPHETGTARLIRRLNPDGPLGAAWLYQLDPPPLGNRAFALIAQCEDSAALWESDSTGRITDAQPLFRSPNANVTELLAELGYNTPEPINPATLTRPFTVVRAFTVNVSGPFAGRVVEASRSIKPDRDGCCWTTSEGFWLRDDQLAVLDVLFDGVSGEVL